MSERKILLFPSMNCADFSCLKDEVMALNDAGADGYHLDISDGTIYPEWSMGLRDIQAIRRNTDRLVDVHLYVSEPSRIIDQMIRAGADIIYVFAESEKIIAHTLYKIRAAGLHPGLCIGWSATVENYMDLYPLVDYLMVNCTDSSTGKIEDNLYDRIRRLAEIRKEKDLDFKILLDGGVSYEVMEKAWQLGADGCAMGTSCLFGRERSYKDIFKDLRKIEES